MDDLELERGMTEGTTTEEIMEGEARVEAETGEAWAKMKEEEARVEFPE